MSQAVTVRQEPPSPVAQVKALVEERRAQLASLLGQQVDVDRFITIALQAVSSRPDLLDCDPLSILSAIRDSAYYNLEPSSALGDGAIVPYRHNGRKLAQFQPMYRGLMKLARRSGMVAAIGADVAYVNDYLDIDLGTDPHIVHRPAIEDRGSFRCVYAWARLASGELVCPQPLTPADVQLIREQSQEYRSKGAASNWVKWPDEMAKKSALKRLMKMLPLEAKATEALALDNEADSRPVAVTRPRPAVVDVRARLGLPVAPSEAVEPELDEPETEAGTSVSVPASVAGEDTTEASPATASLQCLQFEPTLGRCVKDAGHSFNHKNTKGESWAS